MDPIFARRSSTASNGRGHKILLILAVLGSSAMACGCHRGYDRTAIVGPLIGFRFSSRNIACPGVTFSITSETGPMPYPTTVTFLPVNFPGEVKAQVKRNGPAILCSFPPNSRDGTYAVIMDRDTKHEREMGTVYLIDSNCPQ